MMVKRFVLFALVFATLLCACSDDDLLPGGEDVGSDVYGGKLKEIVLPAGMDGFQQSSFVLVMRAGNGSVVKRAGTHTRIDGVSKLTLNEGLKAGEYRLMYLADNEAESDDGTGYGLGCRIRVNTGETSAEVIDKYDSDFQMFGSGSKADPFVISSSSHLERLRDITNSQNTNTLLKATTCFRQFCDIDLEMPSFEAHKMYGWEPIGSQNVCPFRGTYDGNGRKIKGLWIARNRTCGVGLFGHTESATICNVVLVNADIDGEFAVGSIVGAAVTRGDRRSMTYLLKCTTTGGSVTGAAGSAGIGGLVGLVDPYASVMIDSCYNNGTEVRGGYGVGGILGTGSLFSATSIRSSCNTGSVTSEYTGCGGIVGTCDTLMMVSCENRGAIAGSTMFNANGSDTENGFLGTGGIVGGTGPAFICTSHNYSSVSGHEGVGGIAGSSCASVDLGYCNNIVMKSCGNEGAVSGYSSVGGVCGEGQFGGVTVYNTGSVTATANDAVVGGIVGNTSVSLVHDAINTGKITATHADCVGGVVGKTTWGTLFSSQNAGEITTNAKYVGGVVALAGSQTVVSYCSNMGTITNTGSGPTGGIVGEVGDPNNWTMKKTFNCIVGAVEVVLGVFSVGLAETGPETVERTHRFEIVLQIENWEKIHKAAHAIELGFDASTLIYDWVDKSLALNSYLSNEEREHLRAIIINEATERDNTTVAVIHSLRQTAFGSVELFEGLEHASVDAYFGNLEGVMDTYHSSDSDREAFNYYMCEEREARAKDVSRLKKPLAIFHTIVGCATLVVSTTAFVAGLFVAPEGTPALWLGVIGGVSTTVGGINAIAENCDDYQSNVISVTQCANMGKVSADAADAVGGIIGHLQQFGFVADCLNSGEYVGSKHRGGGLVGRSDSQSEVQCCLSVGSGWLYPFCETKHVTTLKDVYFLSEAFPDETYHPSTSMYLNQVGQPFYYPRSWHFDDSFNTWSVTGGTGCFPVPKSCKMQKSSYK